MVDKKVPSYLLFTRFFLEGVQRIGGVQPPNEHPAKAVVGPCVASLRMARDVFQRPSYRVSPQDRLMVAVHAIFC